MNSWLFLGLLLIFGGAYLWIGCRASRKLDGGEDYFLMGRKLGFLPMTLTMLATQLGGGTLLGAAEEAYSQGWMVLFYPLGICLGLCCLAVFGPKLRRYGLTTVSEVFEVVYGSVRLRQLSSMLSIASLFFILIAMGIAARKFLCAVGYDQPLLFGGFWLVLVLYTVMGGLRAVVGTDILQVLFIILSLVLVLVSGWSGWLSSDLSWEVSAAGSSGAPWLRWLLMPLLFMLIEQDMGQRCFAALRPRTISFAAIASAVMLMATSSVAILFGVLAANQGISVEADQSVLIATVQAFAGPAVFTLFICAVLMAIISTADSQLCSIASNLACDLPWLRGGVRRAQWITLTVGMLSLVASYCFDNVVSMLMLSYELSVSLLFVPVVMAVAVRNPKRLAAALSMLFGAVGLVVFNLWSTGLPREPLSLLLAFVGYGVGQWYPVKAEVLADAKA